MSYPLDDAFIHLALAKNLIHHGVFGVTRFAFTSTSSSVLWPFLLAPFEPIFGVYAPVVLATLAASTLPLLAAIAATEENLSRKWVYGASIAAVLLVPTPGLAALGMEHALHVPASLAYLIALRRHLAGRSSPGFFLVASAFLVAGTRYEGGILVALGTCALVLAEYKQWRVAALAALAGLAPIVAFGLWAKRHGALFLPYSVVMKGAHPPPGFLATVGYFVAGAWEKLVATPALAILLMAACCMLFVVKDRPRRALLAVAIGTAALHVCVAAVGWFFRYEAYLIVILGAALLAAGADSLRRFKRLQVLVRPEPPTAVRKRRVRLQVFVLGGGLLLAPALRSAHMVAQTPRAATNIFEQQVQIGRFAAQEFPTAPVAVNDIGAVTYLHDAPIVDLMGLASGSVAKARGYRIASALSPAFVAAETDGVPVAILYDRWFSGQLPSHWQARRRWRISGVITPAFATVTIYACDPSAVDAVDAALARFEPLLPVGVERLPPEL
jgi:hypothetical protein